ncbi:MAG: homocysteine S-methyltransferase family protein [Bacillota bacterium]
MSAEIIEELSEEVLLFDGAMGTQLQEAGLKTDEAPESWNLEHPEEIKKIHQNYLAAGSDMIQTNTFGANRLKLANYDLAERVEEINQAAVNLAQEISEDNYIAGSVGPLGKLLEPMGNLTFREGVEIFKEQIEVLIESGVDIISLETMTDLQELRAAVIAVKEVDEHFPIIAAMTFDQDLRTLSGTTPQVAAAVLESLGVDVIGANCSLGPEGILEVLIEFKAATDKPLIVQPNAGLPQMVEGETIFDQSPAEMADYIAKFVEQGANIVGGCCGTTPDHIRAFAQELAETEVLDYSVEQNFKLTSRSDVINLENESHSLIIGERINPSARDGMTEELREEKLDLVTQEINSQVEAGAKVLDINVGGGAGIDGAKMMRRIVNKVQATSQVSVCIDTTDPEVLEAGLETFAGKALINSVTGEDESLERVLPLAKKYGANLICLALDEDGIPSTAEGRLEIARKIKRRAAEYGIPAENLLIDTLVLTASTKQEEVMATLEAIKLVKNELGLKTVLGISNVSYGLPCKPLLNQTFLAMALGYGLDAYLVDPLNQGIRNTILAGDVLANRDPSAQSYIAAFQVEEDGGADDEQEAEKEDSMDSETAGSSLSAVKQAVLNGNQEEIIELIKSILDQFKPQEIMNEGLIPAIKEVGNKYDSGEYFLPQLMASAETMKQGFQFLKDKLDSGDSQGSKGKVLLATVKGDVHDIGKNIVKIVLENHNFTVVDLGKDVPAEEIVQTAQEEEVDVVGLSALMTTTMVEMETVIELLAQEGIEVKVILGGAVVDESYTNEIGADDYALDAISAVKKIENLLNH